jgi:hypothetical protein
MYFVFAPQHPNQFKPLPHPDVMSWLDQYNHTQTSSRPATESSQGCCGYEFTEPFRSQVTLVKAKTRKLGDYCVYNAGHRDFVFLHIVGADSKARAWEQCEEILLPEIFSQLTHPRARALGIVSKGWAKRAAHAAIIRTEMDDGKFVGLILKYAADVWNQGSMFYDGNKYIVEGEIFQEDVGMVHCIYKGSEPFERSMNGRLIFQLDLTPNLLRQLQVDVSAKPQKGGQLKLKLKFVLKDFDLVQVPCLDCDGDLVQFHHHDTRCSRSARVLSISENSTKLQLAPIPISYEGSMEEYFESDGDSDLDVNHAIPEISFNPVESRYHTKLWAQHQRQQATEGVVWYDAAVPEQLEISLRGEINVLASRNSTDYHPFSNEIVRDLVHPSLYPFVRGVSPFFPSPDLLCVPKMADDHEVAMSDRWGRKYEASAVYQWLPTYFDVGVNSVEIRGEINNLCPRIAYSGLYRDLAKLFNLFVPKLEAVIGYATTVCLRTLADEYIDWDIHERPAVSKPEPAPIFQLRGRALQVITKIADFELQPGQSFEGVWHVEGMSHEHIVATCDYILDRDSDIDGGDLLFKRAFNKDEATRLYSQTPQGGDHFTNTFVKDGMIPLGQVATKAGRVIVFPNSHIHRLSKMTNRGTVPARRRIVVFFVVDPECRIVSTQEVPDQRGTISHEEAIDHRLKLMQERKFAKEDWNVRPINLCEH